jgi:hypothetical protein
MAFLKERRSFSNIVVKASLKSQDSGQTPRSRFGALQAEKNLLVASGRAKLLSPATAILQD